MRAPRPLLRETSTRRLPRTELPATPAAATTAQVIITPPGTDSVSPAVLNRARVHQNVARLSVMTLTVTYNPNVLRVRTAQDGTFMRQGGVATSFTPRIDAAAGRVDIAITRTADQSGASGAGLLAALVFDAVGPGGSVIQVSGVASTRRARRSICSSTR